MEGKIFNDSANIYQDQAKVLYEYYKSAAEKIVNEEKIYEDKIKNAEYQIKKIQRRLGEGQNNPYYRLGLLLDSRRFDCCAHQEFSS